MRGTDKLAGIQKLSRSYDIILALLYLDTSLSKSVPQLETCSYTPNLMIQIVESVLTLPKDKLIDNDNNDNGNNDDNNENQGNQKTDEILKEYINLSEESFAEKDNSKLFLSLLRYFTSVRKFTEKGKDPENNNNNDDNNGTEENKTVQKIGRASCRERV